MKRHAPVRIDLHGMRLLDQHVVPLRSERDSLLKLGKALQRRVRKWKASRVTRRDFRIISSRAAGAVVLLRIE